MDHIESLKKSVLFRDLDLEEIDKTIDAVEYTIKKYKPKDIIAIEGDNCDSIGIVLEGNIEIHKSFPSGKLVTINHFAAGNIFGEALVFTDKHQYPANIISSSDSIVMYIQRVDIIKLMTLDSRILNRFMGVLSNRILMLNQRLTNLAFDTLRKKITNILLLEYNRQKSDVLTLPYSRKKMAELLNVPRPSLSRELVNMKNDGLIDFYKNKFKIIDVKALEEVLE